MSMTEQAVQRIQELGSAPEFLKALASHNLKNPVVALPESFNLHDLEKYMPNRTSFRGAFDTSNADEYAKYCKLYEKNGSQCFINVDRMSAKTIFDIGTQDNPEHCKHTANFNLVRTADYTALLELNDQKKDQKSLAEWIEDYASNLQVFSSEGALIDVPLASAAIRALTFEITAGNHSEVQDFSSAQSEYESMATRTKNEAPMPAVFKFSCVPYQGLPERTFEMRMSTIGNKTLVLRIKQLEQHVEQMGVEFKDLVLNKLAEVDKQHIETFIGTF
ncbi:DUF2303 family protein [Vibrio parahaemolyticus]|uniref:DUF2303 family protein n=1 Tax=Vibrio parahaemolyticus TaxID=670 RepID=UPI00226B36C9|nr:DUF2303 family protein [Vibrio parahaemolyticus]MCX8817005.1 YfdQ family protein [Vibrio parahaemolyticus]